MKITLELLSSHTHAGVLYRPGEQLELDPAQAHWLIGAGVARAVLDPSPEPPSLPEPFLKPRKEK